MRAVFEASYRSFYFLIIGILWAIAISVALLQSSFAIEIAIKNILPKFGVEIESANGGILSGMELRGVKAGKLFSATEIRFRPQPLGILNQELAFSYLEIKDLRLNRVEIEKLIRQTGEGTKKPEFIDLIKIEKLSLTLADFELDDARIDSLKLKSDYLYYNFDKFYMDLSAQIKTNILDATFHGDILDKNYSIRGTLKSNGSQYINKIVDDPDFDFNALRETDFLVRGDNVGLYAKAHIKNSSSLYKYTVDAKINDAISEMYMRFDDWRLRVDTKGELECRYGVLDSEFSVVYDGEKTRYFGKAKAKKFKFIPLGPFANSIRIKEAINQKIEFDGDVKKVLVKAENRVVATLLDKKFDVDSSQTSIEYDIKNRLLKVATKAKLNTDYFKANVESVVEDGKKLSFYGNISNFSSITLGVDASSLLPAKASYRGDEDRLEVNLSAGESKLKLATVGYGRYDFDASLSNLKPTMEIKPEISGRLKGSYDYKKDEILASFKPQGSKILGKPLVAKEIVFEKKKSSFYLPQTTISIGSVEAKMKAKKEEGRLSAFLQSDGLRLEAAGETNGKIKLSAHTDTQKLAAEYAKLTSTPKQNISGLLSLEAELDGSAKNIEFTARGASNELLIGGESLKTLFFDVEKKDGTVTLKALRATYQDRPYYLAKPALIQIDQEGVSCNELAINDTLLGSFVYKNERLDAMAKVTNFRYFDSKISFLLSGAFAGHYENKKLSINGDALLKDLKASFDLKSSRIVKDKDIVILKPKKLEFDAQKLEDNLALHINITSDKKAVYTSKEAYAPITLNMIYHKDFGEKGALLGLIETAQGRYEMEGKRFTLLPSKITLTQSEPNNPYLDLTLRHEDKETQITVYVREFASTPKISFSSKPAMSEKEIISYLLFGVDPESSFTRSSSDAKYSSKAIAALSNALSRDLAKEFGIKLDKIEISPTEIADSSGRTTQATKVEVGKRVTKDLTVTYKNDIESSVVFEYQINKNVSVESQAGRKSSIDIFYKQDY